MKTFNLPLRACARVSALISILLLTACSNTTKPEQLPQFAIANVSASVDEGVRTNSDVAATTRVAAQRTANAYSASLPQSVPGTQLDIRITRIHYKNPVASLLIGDTNTASGVAQVSGGPAKPVAYIDASGAAVNGIVGAAIAIGSNKAKIDAKLAAGLAEAAVASVYGQKSTPEFAKKNLSNGNTRQALTTQQPTVEKSQTQTSRPVRRRKSGGATPPPVPTS